MMMMLDMVSQKCQKLGMSSPGLKPGEGSLQVPALPLSYDNSLQSSHSNKKYVPYSYTSNNHLIDGTQRGLWADMMRKPLTQKLLFPST